MLHRRLPFTIRFFHPLEDRLDALMSNEGVNKENKFEAYDERREYFLHCTG